MWVPILWNSFSHPIGFIVGYEFQHGFDNLGIYNDENGIEPKKLLYPSTRNSIFTE